MKRRVLLAAFLTAWTASAGPIPVSGSGTFWTMWEGGGGFSVGFSGSDGQTDIRVQTPEVYQPNVAATVFAGGLGGVVQQSVFLSTAWIGDTSSRNYSFWLGGGAGYLTLYDSLGATIASADLVSYIRVESVHYWDNRPSGPRDMDGTFLVLNSPEPTGAALTCVGVAVLAFARRLSWRFLKH